MILLAINHKNELIENLFEKYNNLEIKFFNELKGNIFANKLIKHIYSSNQKYKLIIHFGTCGGTKESPIGNIYQIDRTFLLYKDIIDNQKFKKIDLKINGLESSNIVTKFSIGKNPKKLYDFANLFDLETFWVAQIASLVATPIVSIKGVSDHNDIVFNKFNQTDEIKFLLDPKLKQTKKILQLNKLKNNIQLVNNNFLKIFDEIYLMNSFSAS